VHSVFDIMFKNKEKLSSEVIVLCCSYVIRIPNKTMALIEFEVFIISVNISNTRIFNCSGNL